MQINQYTTVKTVRLIERDIDQSIIIDTRSLVARCKAQNLPYSVYTKLYKRMKAKQTPIFLRKQAF